MELGDPLAEAHVSLGVLLQYHDWNWTGGDRELRRAIQLDPHLALARLWYGDGLYMTGRPDQAIEQGRKIIELNAVLGHWTQGLAYDEKRNWQHAIAELQQTAKLSKDISVLPEGVADLAHAYAGAGQKPQTLRLLAELTELAKKKFVPSSAFAIVYVGLGDKDRAFRWLDEAYDERPSDIMNIKGGLADEPSALRSALPGITAADGFTRVKLAHRISAQLRL
jgi:tetratricopeptide (TPR) repeat protein